MIIKNAKISHGLGQDISCIKFLVVSDFEALFKKEAGILCRYGLPLNGVKYMDV